MVGKNRSRNPLINSLWSGQAAPAGTTGGIDSQGIQGYPGMLQQLLYGMQPNIQLSQSTGQLQNLMQALAGMQSGIQRVADTPMTMPGTTPAWVQYMSNWLQSQGASAAQVSNSADENDADDDEPQNNSTIQSVIQGLVSQQQSFPVPQTGGLNGQFNPGSPLETKVTNNQSEPPWVQYLSQWTQSQIPGNTQQTNAAADLTPASEDDSVPEPETGMENNSGGLADALSPAVGTSALPFNAAALSLNTASPRRRSSIGTWIAILVIIIIIIVVISALRGRGNEFDYYPY